MGLNGDKEGVRQLYKNLKKKGSAPTNHARQVMDFYNLGRETLWVTFSNGYLWWTVADKNVEFLSNVHGECIHGSRLKRTIGNGWSNTSLAGEPLLMSKLSGKLTLTARYSGTICKIKDDVCEDLLLKLQGKASPLMAEAREYRQQLITKAVALIKRLSWSDFELFVNLMFERCSWRRVGMLGGDQKTVDIVLERALPERRALVQVKSVTDQKTLNEYVDDLGKWEADHIFYVYHTSKSKLVFTGDTIHLIGPNELAEYAFNLGLVDWLMDKAS